MALDATLRSELAVLGLRSQPPVGRRGGAGPSDDGHLRLSGGAVALPVLEDSPFDLRDGALTRNGVVVEDAALEPVLRPRFYDLETADGIRYDQLARLHGSDVLAAVDDKSFPVGGAWSETQTHPQPPARAKDRAGAIRTQ